MGTEGEFKFTLNAWILLKKIYFLDIKKTKAMSLAAICRSIDSSPSNSSTTKLLHFLINRRALEFEENIGTSTLYRINKTLIQEIIEDNVIWYEFTDYVHKTKLIYADI